MPKWSTYIPYPPMVTTNDEVPGISPKQAAFLILEQHEALYGGSAGGGKSEALLQGATQDVDDWPVSALLLRRTYRDLDKPGGLMFRAREWFTGTKAHWDGINYRWIFPSGATINFGYLDHEGDELKFQCFTPDHEVLTERGWVPVSGVQVGELAATMNTETREMSYERVTRTWDYDYDGDIVEGGWKFGSHLSFAVTPNHSVWASTERSSTLKEYRADELPAVARIPQSADWHGGVTQGTVSFTSDGHNGRTVSFNEDTWASFLGWWISEGSTDTTRWSVSISQVKEGGRDQIRTMLKSADVNFHEGERSFTFNNKALVHWLRGNAGHLSYDKHIPDDVKWWPKRQLVILIEALMSGDGTWHDRNDDGVGRQGVFVTSSRQLADDMCEIGIKAGYGVAIADVEPHPEGSEIERVFGNRQRYRVNLTLRKQDTFFGSRGNKRTIHYEGKVHCVTVPPHHTVLIRHRGKVSWSGQSSEYQYVGFDELTHFPEHQYLYLFSRMRRLKGTPVRLRMRGGTNPGGPGHEWVRKRWDLPGGPPPGSDRVFIAASLEDNPFLQQEEYKRGLEQLGDVTRAQLLRGDWSATSTGGYFQAGNFRLCGWDEVPPGEEFVAIIRYWDFAATEPSEMNPDPDYTVGLKLGMTYTGAMDPTLPDWYILDVERFRGNPGTVENRIRAVADRDGPRVVQWLEQERGSAGKHLTRHYDVNVLPDYTVRSLYATGTKEARAAIAAARANEGRIFLVDGPWIDDFVAECAVFPLGGHDDQVDGLSNGLISIDRERTMASQGAVIRRGKELRPVRRVSDRDTTRGRHIGY